MNCTYCGSLADTRDHVIPYSYNLTAYRGRRARVAHIRGQEHNIVPACRECNSIAGSKVFEDIDEKRAYIQQRIEYKYRRILKTPVWSYSELRELSGRLKREVKLKVLARKWIENRIHHPNILWTDAEPTGAILKYLSNWE